ncbi:transposase domain-containing protein, partial [Klebsiella pneumoniae]
EKQKGSRGIRRGQWYRLVFQFPIREHAAVLYSLIGTCRLNNVEPEKWLRYVIEHIQDWPANRVRDLLPWKVDLTSQ